MRRGLFFLSLLTGLASAAQQRCATAEYSATRLADKNNAQTIWSAEQFLQQQALKTAGEEALIRIPVVVHVLYNSAAQNISDDQIKSGVAALNRDFRRRNADTINTPMRFRHLAADIQIEFYLATADPLGRPTTGIERRATSRLAWMADDKMKQASLGGLDAWNSRWYLNIWICNLSGSSGYATPPGSHAPTDGVVIHPGAFGIANGATPFGLGRTAVHEVGHWLGLKHIWGDTQCGDDGVADTPQQGFFTQGCPSEFRSSCNNSPAGDMFMNYMDYTNDACMNLFTEGQRRRMRAVFADGGPRASLLQSRGLQQPWLAEAAPLAASAALYPNPAHEKIILQTASAYNGKTVTLLNSAGQVVRTEVITSVQQTISVHQLKAGLYFIKGEGFVYKFNKL